jgi:TonB family protein
MTPILKDPENAAAPTAPGISAVPASNASARPQPVALEVPVTVNGARSAEGSDKREPFSERSQTVLVFGHGAVLRISALLSPGQLVFLTNEKTKKEVVCVVVKSKTDGNAVGYVELRFTEPAPGFWGMRFPSDTILPQGAARPGASVPAVAQPKSTPVPPTVVPPAALKPIVATLSAPGGGSTEIPKIPADPTPAASPVSLQASPAADAHVSSVASSPLFAPTDSKPAKLSSTGLTSGSSNQSTDELKQQAARLQEQLSSLLFAEAPKPAGTIPAPALEGTTAPELAKKVLDLTNFSPEPAQSLPVKNVPTPPKPASSSLEVEEIKIPSWLAPLARESETQSAVESSKDESNSLPELEAVVAETSEAGIGADPQESTRRPEAAIFGGQLLLDSSQLAEAGPSKSRTGLFLGIAASLLLIAGGVWYSRQPGNAISGIVGGSSTASQPAASPAAVSATEPEVAKPITRSESAVSKSSLTPTPVNPPAPAVTSAAKNTPPPAPRSTSLIATPNAAPNTRSTAAVEEPKKPALGDVRLATPVINRGKSSSTQGDSEPTLEISESANTSVPLSGLGSSHRAEPAAPVPIGGDVKPAKLIKSVQPNYPAMAKSQHVSGNVQIDALIDADGNVSAMKVLSGPALLREAALQSLKQWKYQAAELDGKPTSMHLTVTLQFRAQ